MNETFHFIFACIMVGLSLGLAVGAFLIGLAVMMIVGIKLGWLGEELHDYYTRKTRP